MTVKIWLQKIFNLFLRFGTGVKCACEHNTDGVNCDLCENKYRRPSDSTYGTGVGYSPSVANACNSSAAFPNLQSRQGEVNYFRQYFNSQWFSLKYLFLFDLYFYKGVFLFLKQNFFQYCFVQFYRGQGSWERKIASRLIRKVETWD